MACSISVQIRAKGKRSSRFKRDHNEDGPRKLSSWKASTSATTFSYLCAVR